MKIVFISKNRHNEDVISNQLSGLCEQDSIAFYYSYADAEDFINNNVIENQIEIDLIILENHVERRKGTEFRQAITQDENRTYSSYNFNFFKIPTVLIVDENENKNAYLKDGFSIVMNNIGIDKLNLFITDLISPVKSWRKSVLDELDSLGIRFNSGKIDYTYFLSPERKRNVDTKILSKNFTTFPRRLDYNWLANNDKQIEKAIDEFINRVKKASRLNKKKEEKAIHKIFNKYPFLIRRDNYKKHWYQPRLYYNETEYHEPDYGLKPNFTQKTDLSILEVKLPNEGFIKKTTFHASPYKRVIEHIFQVNDYKDYMESDEFHAEIRKVFGFLPNTVEYNILMGRLDDKTEGYKVFNKRMRQISALHINFITYDELLDYQVKFLERQQLLRIL